MSLYLYSTHNTYKLSKSECDRSYSISMNHKEVAVNWIQDNLQYIKEQDDSAVKCNNIMTQDTTDEIHIFFNCQLSLIFQMSILWQHTT